MIINSLFISVKLFFEIVLRVFASAELFFPILSLLPIVWPRIILESMLALAYIPFYSLKSAVKAVAERATPHSYADIFISAIVFCCAFPIGLVYNCVRQAILTPLMILVMPIVQTIRVKNYKANIAPGQDLYKTLRRHAFDFADPRKSIGYVCDPSHGISGPKTNK